MTIRAKLTLWYAGVLFGSLVLLGSVLYEEWVAEPRREHRRYDKNVTVDLRRDILLCTIPAAVLGLGGGWLITRKSLSPVAAITQAARRVDETNLKVRLPQSGNGDELDRLTGVFNSMIARLEGSFSRIREFTLRASHELKTPLTIIRGELETTLTHEGLDAAQRERVGDEIEEIDRLTKIVGGLITLTKADAGLIELRRIPVRFDELVRDVFEDGQVLALPANVQLTLTGCEPTTVTGDANRLRQVLLNLLDNAIKYNRRGGSVTLGLQRRGEMAVLTLRNTGPGIAPEILPRLFDPFFRGDAAHSRCVDGCGLGLSISRWIVSAHGGALTITSQVNGLTAACLQLPLTSSGSV